MPCSSLVGSDQPGLCKATVTPDRKISGSYDWLRLGQGATDQQCLLRSPAAANIPRSISTRGRAIMNDWRISVVRAIVGNHATSGSDQRPMYDQS